MSKRKIETNGALVKRFMKENPFMHEVFVAVALNRLSNEIADNEAAIRKEMENGFMHPDLWIQAAKIWTENYYNK